MALLDTLNGPDDLKRIPREQLPELAQEVRDRLIDCVSVTGGHIGASLGVVELAIALLYEFDSPSDKILWDVGHQAYAWKLLTGRNADFPTLRQTGGLSGFLKRSESEHDQFGAGHAGTAMSAALGMAVARDLKGGDNKVVAIVGDGALTCGLSYEGMNNAGHSDRDIILIVNDNGMSISPNVGAISRTLGGIVANPLTNKVRDQIKHLTVAVSHVFGERVVDFAKNIEESAKNLFSDGMFFEEMGFRYFGPIDGHDLKKLTDTLRFVRALKGPRVIHVITEKGKGFAFAEENREKWHGLAAYDPVTGEARKKSSGPPDLDPGLRRRPHGAGARVPRLRGGDGGDAERHRHQHLPEGLARPGSSTWGSPRGTPSPSREGSPPRGSAPSWPSTARSCSGPTTTSSTTSPCSTCRWCSAWTARGWSGKTARPTWACTTSPTCSRCRG